MWNVLTINTLTTETPERRQWLGHSWVIVLKQANVSNRNHKTGELLHLENPSKSFSSYFSNFQIFSQNTKKHLSGENFQKPKLWQKLSHMPVRRCNVDIKTSQKSIKIFLFLFFQCSNFLAKCQETPSGENFQKPELWQKLSHMPVRRCNVDIKSVWAIHASDSQALIFTCYY